MLFVVSFFNFSHFVFDQSGNGWVSNFFLIRHRNNLLSLIYVHFQTQSQETVNPVEIVRPLIIIFWSFATVFYFCETAELVSIQFDGIKHAIWQCDWYLFPNKIQRMLPTVIAGAQTPVIVRGFGNLIFTRQSIKQVNLLYIYIFMHLLRNISRITYIGH